MFLFRAADCTIDWGTQNHKTKYDFKNARTARKYSVY